MAARRTVGVLLATALTVLTSASGAHADAGPTPPPGCAADGVTVLVDFGDLAEGGGSDVRTGCDDDADGDRAAQSIVDAGVELTYATRSPGFVCRVDDLPSDDPCVNAAPPDAYWSVWWADAGGAWVYSTRGVDSLRTPVGGHVALVWHRGAGEAAPPDLDPGTVDDAEDNDAEDDNAPAATGPNAGQDSGSDGLPGWALPVVVGFLAAAGVVVVLRRRQARTD